MRYILLLFFTSIAFAQSKSDAFVDDVPKHQLGVGVSRFVNTIFPSDLSAFFIEFRYTNTPKVHYRLAVDFDMETNEFPVYRSGLKIGIDKSFKRYNKWHFYYGFDIWGRYTYYGKEKRINSAIALNPFLGIAYYFSKNFSISTEPGIYFKSNYFIDNATFDSNNKRRSWESRISKVGYIQLNFHF